MPLKRHYVADVHAVEVVNKIKQNEVELEIGMRCCGGPEPM